MPDRFLFAYPEKVLPYYNPNTVDPKLTEVYEKIIDRLLSLHTDVKNPLQVKYTSDAKTLWTDYHDYLVGMTELSDFPKRLEGVFSKFRGIFSRIVLILHLTKYVCNETDKKEFVDKKTVEQAFALVHYFIQHAKKVYNVVDRSDMDKKIDMIKDYIQKHGEDYIDLDSGKSGKIVVINDMTRNKVFSPDYDSKVAFINEVLNEMAEQELGIVIVEKAKTKPTRHFYLYN